ncbi:hypothetical protein OIU77_022626 [Salix suchowensis]|uniref:Uncharacterized protein n=1 Tax=Salix suchowensis TaxID=1278906 RepID=A0ABQ9C0U8_9ROSI|nr:hypothetical protein OIU77_022626 [Salix suchowensis]
MSIVFWLLDPRVGYFYEERNSSEHDFNFRLYDPHRFLAVFAVDGQVAIATDQVVFFHILSQPVLEGLYSHHRCAAEITSRAIQTKQNAESMKARRDRKQTICRHPNYKIPTATQGRVGPRITMVFVTVL